MTNLIGRPSNEIESLVAVHADRPYRSQQVAHWILHRHATSFDDMTNLPADLRRRLAEVFSIEDPAVVEEQVSRDGSRKFLFRLADGATVEGVAMPEGRKLTLCLSTQAGCAVGCRFCVTGALGAGRNLRPDEIVGQYRMMRLASPDTTERVNIVFMGMGEPLLNTRHLGTALDVLTERVSPKRITVSTSGILPGIRWLAGRTRRPKLAISLNAPDQQRRTEIMPITERYPLTELMDEVRRFPLERGRRVTFEYVLIRDFNDRPGDPAMVAKLLHGVPSKVNVIPFNEDSEHLPGLRQPDDDTINRFAAELSARGLTVTVRWSRGRDVAGACGQLKGWSQTGPRSNVEGRTSSNAIDAP
jgi:23S rRNA (adenine2503-C2)-methyltransferase